jgi:hypothetical protein
MEFRPSLGLTQLPVEWVSGVVPMGIKQQKCKTDHPFTSSDEIKNDGAIPSLHILHSVVLKCIIKYGDKLNLIM